jgi:hypothetical protein
MMFRGLSKKNHVHWVFLCHQFNLSTFSFTQGALNVVMGNAPEIGDALLQSTQVLFPPLLSSISISFLCVCLIGYIGTIVFDTIIYFLLGQEDYVHWINS